MEILTPQDYETNPRKRQRRSPRPCDACRRRKTRCVTKEGDGVCMYCQLRRTVCTFEQEPPGRTSISGRSNQQSNTNDDSINSSIGPKPQQHISPQDSSSVTTPNQTTGPAKSSASLSDSSSPHTPYPPIYHVTEAGVTTMAMRWDVRHPKTSTAPPSPPTLGFLPDQFAELYGLGSDMEPILMRHRPYNPVTHEFSLETHAVRRVLEKDGGQEYPLIFHLASDDKAVSECWGNSCADSIEDCVKPHGPSLIDLFWRHVHPCYPIIAKHAFMHYYSQGHRNIPACLLGAMYLCSLRWWTYDPQLSIRQPPDATLLRRILAECLPQSYHRPRMYSVQAALLLLQCKPEDPLNPDHTYRWGLTCQALAIGQCLGLHLDASDWSIPQWERNLRKRLSWALYMQDRWTALAYGRPVHIHDDDWAVTDITMSSFNDDTAPPLVPDDEHCSIATTGTLLFMKMVQLTQILSTVLSTFYTARTSREQDTVVLHERARPLLVSLNAWYASIPASLGMEVTYQRKLCFHGFLHISYYGVTMTVLRRLVRSTALPPRCDDRAILAGVRQLALQTAQNAIGFVTVLRPDHLEAFWYFTSPYLFSLLGSFTTLLIVTSLSSSERSFWEETLNSYLWKLRMMSKSSEPMQYAVNRLEGVILRGLEHALAVNLDEPKDDVDVSTPTTANSATGAPEFTDFGEWNLPMAAAGEETFGMLGAMAMQSDAIMPNQDIGY
ncbi:Fungal trans [Geosmithia morbida]|uniref:Fungal trans n=1 Tax=Geosmithia morbida TaxID=1094350 RepID=A0A9P4YXV5_9HYPO|nr:Fungal trans [Geosmithia morbida]KAF4123802.1 Fungal trans [Geosmithia morbida]